MPEVVLNGCTAQPLSSYLKALAILRLVSTQVDAGARGHWKDSVFVLQSVLDQAGLLDFFLNRYKPTPMVSPWNGGSGFYPNDDKEALKWIMNSQDERLAPYRKVLDATFALGVVPTEPKTLRELTDFLQKQIDKDDTKARAFNVGWVRCDNLARASLPPDIDDLPLSRVKEITAPVLSQPGVKDWVGKVRKLVTMFSGAARAGDKNAILTACRNSLPDEALPWLDAAFSLADSNDPSYAPLLGSGGNEGRLDYTNICMQCLREFFSDPQSSQRLLSSSLLGTVTDEMPFFSVGQFQPGRAGGFNQGPGFEHKDFPANRWDSVLTLEGAVALASSVSRRQGSSAASPTSPFSFSLSPVGYSSSCQLDGARGEQWLPLWERPTRYVELCHIFREGRATVGGRTARSGSDMARAISTLGTDRGLSSFVRYCYLKRRGDSFVAMPVGIIPVRNIPSVNYLNELDNVLGIIGSLARAKNAPGTIVSAQSRLENAVFRAAVVGDRQSFESVVIELGRVQQWIALVAGSSSDKKLVNRPLPVCLSRALLEFIDDGSIEFRLAVAIASIDRTDKVGSIFANILPVDPQNTFKWASGSGQQAFEGPSLSARLASVLRRRITDAISLGVSDVPVRGNARATPFDIAAFLAGNTDDTRIEALLWGLTLTRWGSNQTFRFRSAQTCGLPVSNGWALLKLLFLPRDESRLASGSDGYVQLEPRIAAMLASGDKVLARNALELARHRLLVDGFRPREIDPVVDFDPIRMAAALLIPVSGVTTWKKRVLRPDMDANQTI